MLCEKTPLDLLTTHSVFWVEVSLVLTIIVADDSRHGVGVASADIAEPTMLAPGQGRLVSDAVNILDPEGSGLRLIQVKIRLSFRTQSFFSAHYLQCGKDMQYFFESKFKVFFMKWSGICNLGLNIRMIKYPMFWL